MAETWGRVAVVTGGASAIGRGVAVSLARHGAAVAIADLDEAKAVSLAGEIIADGGRAIGLACDVTDRGSVKTLQADVERRFGPASLLVANAGASTVEQLTAMSDEAVDRLVQVNLFGVLNPLRTFLPDMMDMREGHVVAVSSTSALLAPYAKDEPIYAATKCAVLGLMLSLEGQLNQFGIGATVLCPGRSTTSRLTDSARYLLQRFGLDHGGSPQEGRSVRRPEEVGEMVVRAIREDTPVVVTDGSQREMFEHGLADLIRSGFDAAQRFDAGRITVPGRAA